MYESSIKLIYKAYEDKSRKLEDAQESLTKLDVQYETTERTYKDTRARTLASIERKHEELCELKDAMEVLANQDEQDLSV